VKFTFQLHKHFFLLTGELPNLTVEQRGGYLELGQQSIQDQHMRTRAGFDDDPNTGPPPPSPTTATLPSPGTHHFTQMSVPRPNNMSIPNPPVFQAAQNSWIPTTSAAGGSQNVQNNPQGFYNPMTAPNPWMSNPNTATGLLAAANTNILPNPAQVPQNVQPPNPPPQPNVIVAGMFTNSAQSAGSSAHQSYHTDTSSQLPNNFSAPPAQLPPPIAGPSDPLAQFLSALQSAYVASNSGQSANSASIRDPEARMAKALEELRQNPVQIPAGVDDRAAVMHAARFLGGPTCSLQHQWLIAREIHGLDGVTPLAGYDTDALGISGCVTSRGWLEIHNPANPHLKLKYFSSSNVGSTAVSSRRLTLAEGENSVDINESFRDLAHMEDLKTSVHTLMKESGGHHI